MPYKVWAKTTDSWKQVGALAFLDDAIALAKKCHAAYVANNGSILFRHNLNEDMSVVS